MVLLPFNFKIIFIWPLFLLVFPSFSIFGCQKIVHIRERAFLHITEVYNLVIIYQFIIKINNAFISYF